MATDIHAIARDLGHALRPLVPIPLRGKTTRRTFGDGADAPPARRPAQPGAAVAATPATPAKPAPTRRDLSRIVEVQVIGGAITLAMRPKGRHTPEQQAARHAEADALLADAIKAAPDTHIRVALRGRVIASTDVADIVSIVPPPPKHPPAAPPKR